MVKCVFNQFILYSAVGAVGTGAHFLALITLIDFIGAPPLLSSSAGFVIGAVVNYLLNFHITFKGRNPHRSSFAKFFIVAGLGMGLNALIFAVAILWTHYLLSQMIATGLVLFWTFGCSRYWTFREFQYVGK